MKIPTDMEFEVKDPIKALQQIIDITLALRDWERIHESAPTDKSQNQIHLWRTRRDKWLTDHEVKNHDKCS